MPFEVSAARTFVDAVLAVERAVALVALTFETVRFRRTASGLTLTVPDADTEMYRSGAAACAALASNSEPIRASPMEVETSDFLVSFITEVSHTLADD